MNPKACDLTRRNASLNNLSNRIEIQEADIFKGIYIILKSPR